MCQRNNKIKKLFKKLIDIVNRFVSLETNVVIDAIDEANGHKLSITLTYSDSKMASIELLPDGTCDLMVIEIESEEVIYSSTTMFEKVNDLESKIDQFLLDILALP